MLHQNSFEIYLEDLPSDISDIEFWLRQNILVNSRPKEKKNISKKKIKKCLQHSLYSLREEVLEMLIGM